MTKFYDDNRVLGITMRAESGEDFSQAFFQDVCNGENYNEYLEAYRVDDVTYLVDYAKSYLDGTNPDVDYPDDYDPDNPDYDLNYETEDRPATDPVGLETEVASPL